MIGKQNVGPKCSVGSKKDRINFKRLGVLVGIRINDYHSNPKKKCSGWSIPTRTQRRSRISEGKF